MNLERPAYGDIFDQRGKAYAHAMTRWPQARDAEFAALFSGAPVAPGQSVLDVPSGGGYLRTRLPMARVIEAEFSAGFGSAPLVVQPLGEWPQTLSGPFDHIACLAALHHIQEGDAFIRRLVAKLAPSGVLHLADVAATSGIARLLDGFVDRHNQTGHAGQYRTADARHWSGLGNVLRCEEQLVPWHFAGDGDMAAFTAGLFGVTACEPREMIEALETQVGVMRDAAGVHLQWRLWYVDLSA